MTFDLVVTIGMHFYERCQTKRDVCNFRFENKGDSSSKIRLSVCLPGDAGLGYFWGVQNLEFQYFSFFGGRGSEKGIFLGV